MRGKIELRLDRVAHIFDLFVQADYSSTKSHGGLGIGLTLVRNLVEMHGGSVSAFSEGLGKGRQFQSRLFTNASRDQALSENSSSGS